MFHSFQSSIVSLALSYSSTIVEWTADLWGLKMLNSKILCEEILPDNSDRCLTPPGELVMAVTSYQAQLRIMVPETPPLPDWLFSGRLLGLPENEFSAVSDLLLWSNLPMNYKETKPSITDISLTSCSFHNSLRCWGEEEGTVMFWTHW